MLALAPRRAEELGDALGCLAAEERDRIGRFHDPVDGACFAAGRVLVRLALGRILDTRPGALVLRTWCERCRSDHGKPRVANPAVDIDFSLSRSGRRLALAVAGARVGVDIERCDRRLAEPAAAVALTDVERRELQSVAVGSRGSAFITCWTRKEALLKALGHGLAVEPATVSVTFLEREDPRVRRVPAEFGSPSAWSILPFADGDRVGAAAVEGAARLRVSDAQYLLGGRPVARRNGGNDGWLADC